MKDHRDPAELAILSKNTDKLREEWNRVWKAKWVSKGKET